MPDETRQIQVLLGPYRDHRLTVSSADADAAINSHWAIDPFHVADPDEEPHPPLSEAERTAALEAAQTWAQAQWDAAQGTGTPPEPPPEGTPVRRDVKPEDRPGGYATRHTSPVTPPAPKRER
ncbi:MAG: hypothetical protein EHM67_10300 [Hyphomicrobiaceae bacterium]|nr:MAG: hypothetical protein EHM67_10300 [Hyphomicrobiaceae bacterium]